MPRQKVSCEDCLAKLEEIIANKPVVILGMSWCQFTGKAKVLARQKYGNGYVAIDIDLNKKTAPSLEDAANLLLTTKYGSSHKTWPRVFINKRFVGGYNDFAAGKKG